MQLQHTKKLLKTKLSNYYDRHLWLQFLCKVILFYVIIFCVLMSVAIVLGRVISAGFPIEERVWKSGALFLSLIYSTQWMLLYEKKHYSLGLTLTFKRVLLFLCGLAVGMLLFCLYMIQQIYLVETEIQWNPAWNFPNYIQGFFVTFFASGIEELMNRGILFVLLRYWLGIIPAIFSSSIFFSLQHFGNESLPHSEYFIVFMIYAMSGIFYATAFVASKTLWLPIGLHTGWNWVIYSTHGFQSKQRMGWFEPLLLVEYVNPSEFYLLEMQWISILFLKILFCYYLIRSNKPLYRTLYNYFRKTESRIHESTYKKKQRDGCFFLILTL